MTDRYQHLQQLREQLRIFVAERDWQQFHTPKNLASALAVEAAELLEPFQWLKSGELTELSEDQQTAIRHEMADVLNYLVMLADRLNVDLVAAAQEKIILNAQKYPKEFTTMVGLVRGYSAAGDFKQALSTAKSALAQAPDAGNKSFLEQMIKKLEAGKDVN